jgi:adenylate cyclase
MRFVILSIDLKGSTKMSQELSLETNAQIISLYLREMALVVEKFNGYVLKYVGDGLIAYFPEPNMIGMTDNALDCAATMKKMILFGLNSALKDRKLPTLSFRIGLDSGEAMVKTIGAESGKIHKDLIG